MDFNIGLEDVGIAGLQELWNRVTLQGMELARETSDVLVEKDQFQEFARNISQLNIIFQAVNTRKIEAEIGSEFTMAALGRLNSQLEKACKIIKDCKSGSRLRVLLQSSSKLSQMQELAKEIALTISSFQLLNLNIGLNLKNMVAETIDRLHTMEFQSSIATESIACDIQSLMREDRKSREKSLKLLEKIAEAVGAYADTSLVEDELAILKQEKEEMEAQKKQAEALQLSQLIQLLYSTEIITEPPDEEEEEVTTYHRNYLIGSFLCPLSKEMMVDPVAIVCGHSFERNAIKHYFEWGEITCPVCKEELPSLDVTPNISLRGSIEEWKRRDRDLKFQAAIEGVKSDDLSRQNSSLVELQYLMEMPSYAAKVAEENLIPKFVNFLKDKRLNAEATLKCLYCLAKDSEVNKDAIVGAGAIRRIMKQMYKHQYESIAIALLLELSKKETIAEKIGDTKNWIPLLVSMLHNNQGNVSEIAHKVLQNLSYNTHFVVKMAEAGYFKPFITRFTQGSQETRAMMTAALVQMQAIENCIDDLKNEQFLHCLVQMLSSSSPACKSASLKAIMKFTAYTELINQLLADTVTIPLLLGLIIYHGSDSHLKGEAVEILALLVGNSESGHFQTYHGLKELQSKHNVTLFLQLASSSNHQTKIQFLHLLVELSNKSEEARNLIRSDGDAIVHLFSCLHSDQPAVKKWAMKLLYSVSEGHPDGIPVPESPEKEITVNTLASILTYSPDVEERTIAAGIISQLPRDDIAIDDMLRKSEALKAIHDVISGMDMEQNHSLGSMPNRSDSLLENALAALLRYTEPTKPELQKQVRMLELHPSLIRVLSRGTSLAKERSALVLAHLSQSTSLSVQIERNLSMKPNHSTSFLYMMNYFPRINWCCAPVENGRLCPVHDAACLSRDAFCLIKADALKPLIQSLSDPASGVQEAALMALETLLTDSKTLSQAAAAIVDTEGIVAILQVLQKGSLPAKLKALDLYRKILSHISIPAPLSTKIEGVLIQLLHENALKKKAALVLRQMKVIPEQSSYF